MRDLERRIARLEKLVRSKRVKSDLKPKREVEVGWSFSVTDEIAQDNIGDLIYDAAEVLLAWEKQDLIDEEGEITDTGWSRLFEDMLKVEKGCVNWLKSTFIHAVADGHDNYDDLVGRVWVDPENSNHIKEMSGEYLNSNEFVLNSSSGTLDWSIFESASDFGQSLLSASLVFEKEGLDDILSR